MMNEHERNIYESITSLDDIKNSIRELSKLDLNSISINELKEKIHTSFPIIPFGEVKWDGRYHIYRVRRNFKNKFDEPYKSLCNIGIPPANVVGFGRANNEYQPIFYGSNEGDLALFESCQNLKESQQFEPQNFTMGIWKVKKDEILRLVPITNSEISQKNRSDLKTFNDEGKKVLNANFKSEKVIQAFDLISNFFANQFAKTIKNKNTNEYKISSFLTDYILDFNKVSRIQFDGILYPSVAHKFRADNVALFPQSLNKLEIVKCLSVTSYNFDYEKGTLTKGIIAEGKPLENEEITWKKN